MGISGQLHAPAALYPRERTYDTHCTGGWLGPRAGLDTEARGKILFLRRGVNSGLPVFSQTLYSLSYPDPKIQVKRLTSMRKHNNNTSIIFQKSYETLKEVSDSHGGEYMNMTLFSNVAPCSQSCAN
jgi:hypothetical protein